MLLDLEQWRVGRWREAKVKRDVLRRGAPRLNELQGASSHLDRVGEKQVAMCGSQSDRGNVGGRSP